MTWLVPVVRTWWFRDEDLNWQFTRGLDLSDIYTQRSCIKHKLTSKKGCINCIECDVEALIWNYVPYQKGVRFETKPPPLEALINRERGLCWCSSAPVRPRRKYYSDEHAEKYVNEMLVHWSHFRYRILRKVRIEKEVTPYGFKVHESFYPCNHCKGEFPEDFVDVDHIQAVALGGWMFDESNLQVLCKDCHAVKTKSDVGILAWWRRESNYDAAAIEIEVIEIDKFQQTLELFA